MPLNKVNYVDGQTVIPAQNMNDIQDEIIRLGEKEPVQSNWLEKDENSLAYIKNKPFGSAGQYRVLCTAETMAASNNLIEINTKNDDFNNQMNDSRNNGSNVYYLYKINSGMWFDLFGIGLYQKIAFEYSDREQYLTIQDLKNGGGNTESLSRYIDNPNVVSGKVYFYTDITYDLATSGIVSIEDSSDSTLTAGLYVALNAQKKSCIARVLSNSSYLFNAPGALSMIDMPLAVNYAALVLDGVKQPLQPMIDSVQESLNNFSSNLDNKVDKETGKGLSEVNFTKTYETQVKSISSLQNRIANLESYHTTEHMEEEDLKRSAMLIANEIAANPYGVYSNAQELLTEYEKLMSGQGSEKMFMMDPNDSSSTVVKLSDKLPSKDDFKKGFSFAIGQPDTYYNFMIMTPLIGVIIPSITFDPSFWENMGNEMFIDLDDGNDSFVACDYLAVIKGDSMGIPTGLYAPVSFSEFVLGLQINGFDLNASSAPVSRAQIEDILLFIEESMITFTVNGVSHRAIKGMTWGEWVSSRYNDTELTIVTHWQAGQIIGIDSSYVLRPYTYVHANDLIQAEEYSLSRETSEPT